MDASLFVASGTMGNLASLLAHCGRGRDVILGDESHIYHYENGSASALGGLGDALLELPRRVLEPLADLPLAEDVPLDGVRKGPRSIDWVPTTAATLQWVEALDGGDPRANLAYIEFEQNH